MVTETEHTMVESANTIPPDARPSTEEIRGKFQRYGMDKWLESIRTNIVLEEGAYAAPAKTDDTLRSYAGLVDTHNPDALDQKANLSYFRCSYAMFELAWRYVKRREMLDLEAAAMAQPCGEPEEPKRHIPNVVEMHRGKRGMEQAW